MDKSSLVWMESFCYLALQCIFFHSNRYELHYYSAVTTNQCAQWRSTELFMKNSLIILLYRALQSQKLTLWSSFAPKQATTAYELHFRQHETSPQSRQKHFPKLTDIKKGPDEPKPSQAAESTKRMTRSVEFLMCRTTKFLLICYFFLPK